MTVTTQRVAVRLAGQDDLEKIAVLNAETFTGNRGDPKLAQQWVEAHFNAYPTYMYCMLEVGEKFAGYIGWQWHGGFARSSPVLELEQVAILRAYQGNGLFGELFHEGLKIVLPVIQEINTRIESHFTVVVWGYASNFNAMKAYARIFTDGARGFRIMHGNRAETMYSLRVPYVREEG